MTLQKELCRFLDPFFIIVLHLYHSIDWSIQDTEFYNKKGATKTERKEIQKTHQKDLDSDKSQTSQHKR